MRFKETLSDYVLLNPAARMLQERANMSEEEAREDVVFAIQEFKLHGRARNVQASEPRYKYSGDWVYDAVVRGMGAGLIDWDRSLVKCRHGDSIPSYYEFEVKRRELEALCKALETDKRQIEPKPEAAERGYTL